MRVVLSRFWLSIVALALCLFAATGVPAGAQAQGTRSVSAPRYDVALNVLPNGQVNVRETQTIAFSGGPFQKGFRRIPLRRVEAIQNLRVEEAGVPYQRGSERPGTFNVTRQGDDLLVEWWFPQTTNATRTFVISYTLQGAVAHYEGGDQIRWIALPEDRPYPVGESVVTLTLPAAVPAQEWRLDAYPRSVLAGSTTPSGATASVNWLVRNLPANRSFEIRAQWPDGVAAGAPPSWQAAADREDWIRENLRPVLTLGFGAAGLAIPVLGIAGIFLVWYTRGRDPHIGSVPRELEAPPSDLPPGLAGTVTDERADVQDVIATVLDLASRGAIRITERVDQSLHPFQRDFELELVHESVAVLPFEREVLDSIFRDKRTARLSQLGDWFGTRIPVLQEQLYAEAHRAGLFHGNPDQVRRRYRQIGMGVLIAGVVLGMFSSAIFGEYTGAAGWPFFGLALVGGVLVAVAKRMPRRTAAGALEAARWRAYARYLAKAGPDASLPAPGVRNVVTVEEARERRRRRSAAARSGNTVRADKESWDDDRDRNFLDDEALALEGEVFERSLPYAVALGIDRTWVTKFATIGTPAPRWLQRPPVVVVGGPGWGGPWVGTGPGPWVGHGPTPSGWGGPSGSPASPPPGAPVGPGGLQEASDQTAGGLERASGSLVDLLNAASEVLSRGGGSDWSGGGFGGGSFGGGGGGFGGGGGGGSGFE